MSKNNQLGESLALGFYSKHCEAMDEFAWAGDPDDGMDDEWHQYLVNEFGEELAEVFVDHKDALDTIYSAAEDDAVSLLRAAKSEFERAVPRLGLSPAKGGARISRSYWHMTASVRLRRPGPPDKWVLGLRVFIAAVEHQFSIGLSLLTRGGLACERRVLQALNQLRRDLPTGENADLEPGEVLLWSAPLLKSKSEDGVAPVDLAAAEAELADGLASLDKELFVCAFNALKEGG